MNEPSELQQAPQPVAVEKSIAFKAGQNASRSGEKLVESALKNLHPASRQYADFIAGYDNPNV